MSLAPLSIMSIAAPGQPLRAVLRVCVFFSLLALLPLTARAEDACALKCVQRQSTCSDNCAQGERCIQHCGRASDACLLRCQKTEEARETAQQRQSEKLCFNADGKRHKCTAAEARQLREDMQQASKFLCRDAKGEMSACPDQLKQLGEARQILERDCPGGTCTSDASK